MNGHLVRLTLVAAAGIMAVIAAGACMVPARRGARTSPMIALRED